MPFLSWNNTECGFDNISYPASELWLPSIQIAEQWVTFPFLIIYLYRIGKLAEKITVKAILYEWSQVRFFKSTCNYKINSMDTSVHGVWYIYSLMTLQYGSRSKHWHTLPSAQLHWRGSSCSTQKSYCLLSNGHLQVSFWCPELLAYFPFLLAWR